MASQTISRASDVLRISKPSVHEKLHFTSVPGSVIAFEFDPATAAFARSGNDLTVKINEGGSVTLSGFFAVGDQPLPSLTLPDGNTVASADFLATLNLDFAPGPVANGTGTSSGVGEYSDEAGSLISGTTRLDLSVEANDIGQAAPEAPGALSDLVADSGLVVANLPDNATLVYATAETNTIHGSRGTDIFAWKLENLDGGTDRVMDFSLAGNDKLLFEDLNDPGSIAITSRADNTLTLSIPEGESGTGGITVEVSFNGNELQQFTAAHMDGGGTEASLNAALINAIIQNATGG